MSGATVENEVINEEDLNFELNAAAEDTVKSQERPTPKPRIDDPTHEYPGQRTIRILPRTHIAAL